MLQIFMLKLYIYKSYAIFGRVISTRSSSVSCKRCCVSLRFSNLCYNGENLGKCTFVEIFCVVLGSSWRESLLYMSA